MTNWLNYNRWFNISQQLKYNKPVGYIRSKYSLNRKNSLKKCQFFLTELWLAVCQGYTRTEKYLLGLCGIKSHEVGCHVGSELHSIICIDDRNSVYSDPCWNAGTKDLPFTGLSREGISKQRKLFSIETETFRDTGYSIPRETVKFYSDIYDTSFGKYEPYLKQVTVKKADKTNDKVVSYNPNKMDINRSR